MTILLQPPLGSETVYSSVPFAVHGRAKIGSIKRTREDNTCFFLKSATCRIVSLCTETGKSLKSLTGSGNKETVFFLCVWMAF